MSAEYKKVSEGLPRGERQRYATGIDLVGNFVDSLQRKGLLPKKFVRDEEMTTAPSGSREAQLPLVLKPIPFEIEIPTVSEEVYIETRRAVETAIPGVFIAPVRSVTMEILLSEDRQREQRGEPRRLGFINESKTMRATLPPAMEVFIDPSNFRIDRSNRLSTDAQKAKIAEEAAKIRERLPESVRRFVVWPMMDPSTVSQAEDQYMDTHNGELLMPDFFIRTDVQTVEGGVAHVGHDGPHYRRHVNDWPRDHGYDSVFAGLVGVLPQKLAS